MSAAEQELPERYLRMPDAKAGMAIGLFGGSFNPPHEGHALVAMNALDVLKLDQLWWMVSPGNPLKDHSELAPLPERLELSEELLDDARIKITAFEAAHQLHYSADTIDLVQRTYRRVNFVWVMGADSLGSFHKWDRWEDIVQSVPIAVYDRPGSTGSLQASVMSQKYLAARLDEGVAESLKRTPPPAWTFIHGPLSPLSSTELREAAGRNKS
jgi:nicotinate-nucleotide adenylyltransferase